MYYDADLKDWYRIRRLNKWVHQYEGQYDFLDALDLARAAYDLETKEHLLKLNEQQWIRSLKRSG